jgi:hypothetical protein
MAIEGNLYAAFEERFRAAGSTIAFSIPGGADVT